MTVKLSEIARLGLVVGVLASAPFGFGQTEAPSVKNSLDPVLQRLLEFHPFWVTRTVTSHDQTGGNDDGSGNGNAPETLDGVTYQTLFHGEGEGQVLRIWMTTDEQAISQNYQELRIEVDGTTFYRGTPLDFFAGKSLWLFPLVAAFDKSSGGLTSYVPIPYKKDAKILFLGSPNYFQVTYRQGPLLEEFSAEAVSRFMSDRSWVQDMSTPPIATAKMSEAVATGPITISGLKLVAKASELLDLRVRVGALDPVPAAFFFGLGTTGSQIPNGVFSEVHSELNDISIQGEQIVLETRLPIPLQGGESLSFESASHAKIAVSYALSQSAPTPGVHLDLQYRDQPGPGIPTTMTFYETTAATQFVSLVEQINGNPRGNMRYLEGDEMVRTDQMTYPLELGTGTEDYFNGGWYFNRGPFTAANSGEPRFNAVTRRRHRDQPSFEHSLYRHHVFDPIVGRAGMRFGFEAGDIGDFTPIHYVTLATAYRFDEWQPVGSPIVLTPSGSVQLITSRFDAEYNQPDVHLPIYSTDSPLLVQLPCPEGATGLLLVRTYDAARPLNAATISLNGNTSAILFEAYANSTRSFAQDAAWIPISEEECRTKLTLEVTPVAGRHASAWNAASYSVQFFGR